MNKRIKKKKRTAILKFWGELFGIKKGTQSTEAYRQKILKKIKEHDQPN